MTCELQFRPASSFNWNINRAERSRQVRWLAPLLERPNGRAWLLSRLECSCSLDEAKAAEPFHLCFPLRDVFTADYYQCRGQADLEDQFIAYYNALFNLPEGFGIEEVWKTAPGGRAGWYD